MERSQHATRRAFLTATAAAAAGFAGAAAESRAVADDKALVAITLDLEMSRNFPTWADTHWDFEKGNLDAQTKRYAVEACRRVRAAGSVIHCFAVGRVFEQEDIDWLKEIVETGHPVGNHTYDHVNVLATRPQDVQFRFQRAPWLIEGKEPAEVIRDNIRLTNAAMKARLGIAPAGFRTPGGFRNGLRDRADVRQMLLDLGFSWVSSLYPAHLNTPPGEEPGPSVWESLVKSQAEAQPFVYADGLIEIPMSPISDIGAFRNGRWSLDGFLEALRRALGWSIEHRAAFDFLGHPSCLAVTDPEFRAVDLICSLVRKAGERAALVRLDALAQRTRERSNLP